MGCELLIQDGEIIGHICFADGFHSPTGYHETMWCFGCRTYALHWLYVFLDSSGWYEPEPSWRCVYCGKDRTTFPGY